MKKLDDEQLKAVKDVVFRFDGKSSTFSRFKNLLRQEGLIQEDLEPGSYVRWEGFNPAVAIIDRKGGGTDCYILKCVSGEKVYDSCHKSNLVLISENEYRQEFIKEAKKRGYKHGVKIKDGNNTFTLEGELFWDTREENPDLCIGTKSCCVTIFKDGDWSKIIEAKEKFVSGGFSNKDVFEFPPFKKDFGFAWNTINTIEDHLSPKEAIDLGWATIKDIRDCISNQREPKEVEILKNDKGEVTIKIPKGVNFDFKTLNNEK